MGNSLFTFGNNISNSLILNNQRNPNIPDLPDDILRLIGKDASVEFSWTCKKLNQYWQSNVAIFDNNNENHEYLENIRYLRIINWNYWKRYNFVGITKNLRVLLINVSYIFISINSDIINAFNCPEIKFCFYIPMWPQKYEIYMIDKKFPKYHEAKGGKYQRTYMDTAPHEDGSSFWAVRAIYKKI